MLLLGITPESGYARRYFGIGVLRNGGFKVHFGEGPVIFHSVARSACGKLKDSPRLLAESLGGYDVFYMNFDQSSCVKILVADDHHIMREAVTELLNGEEGFEVCAQAASGHEAVQLAEQINPDVIVMDVSMPEMDGMEATTLIRKSHPDAKILALSMHDNELVRNRMHAAGAAAYINKDALSGELIEAIRQLV